MQQQEVKATARMAVMAVKIKRVGMTSMLETLTMLAMKKTRLEKMWINLERKMGIVREA